MESHPPEDVQPIRPMLRPCPRASRTGSPPERIVTIHPPSVDDRLAAKGSDELRFAVSDCDRKNRAFITFDQMAIVVIDRAVAATLKSVEFILHHHYHA